VQETNHRAKQSNQLSAMVKSFITHALLQVLLLQLSLLFKVNDACLNNDHPDRVRSLPGLDMPLPSRWFSGYLHYELLGRNINTHYVLVEAEEVANESNVDKPLIYWTNGGPGASSLFGLMTEIGNLILSDSSLQTGEYKKINIATPLYNSNSLARLGSLFIIDQPAPVGFSYCNNDTESHSCGGIDWTDELASQNAYLALKAFYQKFACLKKKDLYLTGESYAGIYVPTLARRIVEGNHANNEDHIPLQGFAVGDGCLGTETGVCGELGKSNFVDIWKYVFLAGHGQIPLKSFQELLIACHYKFNEPSTWPINEVDEKACEGQLRKIEHEVGGFYDYALYDECGRRNGLSSKIGGGINDYPCGGGAVMEDYFKLQSVKDALHVKSTFFEVDNAEGDFSYTPTEKDLTGFYKDINGKLKVLIYNGDTDPAITSFAAQNWTSQLGFKENEAWRPWTLDGCRRMGGYVVRYNRSFDYLTIRGAGHLVPRYKPAAAIAFFKAWIEGSEYPLFVESCFSPQIILESNEKTSVLGAKLSKVEFSEN